MSGDFSPQVNAQLNFGSAQAEQKIENVDLTQFIAPAVQLGQGIATAVKSVNLNETAPQLQAEVEGVRNAFEAGDIDKQTYKIRLRDINKAYSADHPGLRREIQSIIRSADQAAAAPVEKSLSAFEEGVAAGNKALAKEATILGTSIESVRAMKVQEQKTQELQASIAVRAQTSKISTNDFVALGQSSFNQAQVALQNRTAALIRENGGQPLDAQQTRSLLNEYYTAVNQIQANLDASYRNNAKQFGVSISREAIGQVNTIKTGFLQQGKEFLENQDAQAFYTDQVVTNESLINLAAQNKFGKFMVVQKGIGDRGIQTLAEVAQATASGNNAQLQALKANPVYGAIFKAADDSGNLGGDVVDGVTQLYGLTPDTRADTTQAPVTGAPAPGTTTPPPTNVTGIATALTDPRTDSAVITGLQGENKAETIRHFISTQRQVPDVYTSLRRKTLVQNKTQTPALLDLTDEATKAYVHNLRIDAVAQGELGGNLGADLRVSITEQTSESSVSAGEKGGFKTISKPTGWVDVTGPDASPLVSQRVNRMYNILQQYPELWTRVGADNAIDAVKAYLDIPLSEGQQ